MKTIVILLSTVLLVSFGCRSTDHGSETKTIYDANLISEHGLTLGPISDAKGGKGLLLCTALKSYNVFFKGFNSKKPELIEKGLTSNTHCESVFLKEGKMKHLSSVVFSDYQKEVDHRMWQKCLRDQFWFCDATKIRAHVAAAFSFETQEGKVFNGKEWVNEIEYTVRETFEGFLKENSID